MTIMSEGYNRLKGTGQRVLWEGYFVQVSFQVIADYLVGGRVVI